MSATAETTVDAASLRALQDRIDITDVLYRYSSAVDSFDAAGVRSALADDIWAQYGNGEPVEGGDKLAAWIVEATATIIWQHHLLNVYHVTIDGDQAKTLSYLTSYQVFKENPDAAIILVARYHDELRRTPTAGRSASGSWSSCGASRGRRGLSGRPRRPRAQDLAARLTTNRLRRTTMAIVRTACTMTLDRKDLDEVVGIFETFIKDVRRRTTASSPTTTSSTRTRSSSTSSSGTRVRRRCSTTTPTSTWKRPGVWCSSWSSRPLHYYGDPTPEEEAQMAGFGNVHIHRPLGGIAEPPPRPKGGRLVAMSEVAHDDGVGGGRRRRGHRRRHLAP